MKYYQEIADCISKYSPQFFANEDFYHFPATRKPRKTISKCFFHTNFVFLVTKLLSLIIDEKIAWINIYIPFTNTESRNTYVLLRHNDRHIVSWYNINHKFQLRNSHKNALSSLSVVNFFLTIFPFPFRIWHWCLARKIDVHLYPIKNEHCSHTTPCPVYDLPMVRFKYSNKYHLEHVW